VTSIKPRSFLHPLLVRPDGLALINVRTGVPLATTLEPAFDSTTRNKGLLGRSSLAPGTALVLAPCNSIHTFFMKFPIDLLFVARDGRVLKLRERVPAWRLALSPRAFAVIELAAGTVATHETQRGDVLVVRDLSTLGSA
jgi:uncharacterized membrane protein (UPF0127 family)